MTAFVVTCIGHDDALPLPKIDAIIEQIKSALSDAFTLSDQTKKLAENAIDLHISSSSETSWLQLKEQLKSVICAHSDVDIIVQVDNEFRHKKLVVFDMDSTLIYQEVIELIAAYAGVEDKVRDITERAMNNELDFKQSLRERVKLLKGIKIDHLYDEIKQKLLITNGVPELCEQLHANGCKLAVLSGGFVPFANYIKEKLHLDFARANVLETDDEGVLTGVTTGPVVDGELKAETLLQLCEEYGIPKEASCMVGDGGNDLPAMAAAGFGVAWNAKPKVQELAPARLNTSSMVNLLHVFGYSSK
ncbi:hypothetical protein HG536_0E05140 [Torulaspora globosa]|uniref:phosphoserine phosphatase n=1 Tax=Torulaspora globosa TaxID=48254 RepID=A0A7G3ZJB7_9SACH|nr:uncharacterized protein HG536_0E05140 [Torulaspora globosa]QLL33603.1 hypothetical protein HG536_0E05140 [Torulaspora globosa]